MSADPLLLRVIYSIIPKHVCDKILPSSGKASFSRQAVAVFGVTFFVGAAQEAFMIKTGFYEVATRKEAERRAMKQWEIEEAARLRGDVQIGDGGRSKAMLAAELLKLRERERAEGVRLDEEKAKIKELLQGKGT
mmetsp:Transcript_32743/g.79294  ORF Transcript_32743/g.79294 Transcript_32743/m.79294 type:complete len:135 (-) Transcript_32743:23-427(-)